MTTTPEPEHAAAQFHVGQVVRIRDEFRRPGDFKQAVIAKIEDDDTIDVEVDGKDWGQWFCRLDDGSYEIEPVPSDETGRTFAQSST